VLEHQTRTRRRAPGTAGGGRAPHEADLCGSAGGRSGRHRRRFAETRAAGAGASNHSLEPRGAGTGVDVGAARPSTSSARHGRNRRDRSTSSVDMGALSYHRMAPALLAAWRGWGSSMRSHRRLIGGLRQRSGHHIAERNSAIDGRFVTLRHRHTRGDRAPATRSNRSVVLRVLGKCVDEPSNAARWGANQKRDRAYGRAADRAPCRRTAAESGRRPAAPNQSMSGTVRTQRAPRREVL
jgi:hypothetical protein